MQGNDILLLWSLIWSQPLPHYLCDGLVDISVLKLEAGASQTTGDNPLAAQNQLAALHQLKAAVAFTAGSAPSAQKLGWRGPRAVGRA